MFDVKKIKDKKYGRCIRIQNGSNEMLVTLDFGPRIISLKRSDGSNIMGEDVPTTMFVDSEQWKLIGGHRFWHGPEAFPRTYIPDNDAVGYEIYDDKVVFTQCDEKMTKLKKTIEISAIDDHSFKVIHRLKNNGIMDVRAALWAITVLRKGGVAIMPMNDKDTGFLPNRKISLWPYTNIRDSRFEISNRFIAIRQSAAKDKLKIGIDSKKLCACYIEGSDIFIKRFDGFRNVEYIDGGCNLEIYTDDSILELETLSPLYEIKVGEERSHEEVWELIKFEDEELINEKITDKDFEKIIDKYMDFR